MTKERLFVRQGLFLICYFMPLHANYLDHSPEVLTLKENCSRIADAALAIKTKMTSERGIMRSGQLAVNSGGAQLAKKTV